MTNFFVDVRRFVGLGCLMVVAMLEPMAAQALDKPEESVVLTIAGHVTVTNAGQSAIFDMKMLESLPQSSFVTMTPWYPDAIKFTGPLLRDVLKAAGAQGTRIKAVALNDFRTVIPVSDAYDHEVIVARLLNDKPMSVRDKGPLFIVYPYDTKQALRGETYYNRSAWQLYRLIVE